MNTADFLGIRPTHNPHRWYLPVIPKICVHGDFLFGGCGLAAAVTALERTCDRPLIWATAQYLSFARAPSILDIDVTIPVGGKQTTQARAIGRVCDDEILTVNAALGARSLEVGGQWERMPELPGPMECPAMPIYDDAEEAISHQLEFRVAKGRYGAERDGTPSPDGRSALWARMKNGSPVSSASLAIIADWVPSGMGQALGRMAGATSLDNTVRILQIVETEWVLCDIRVQGIRKGFGHGLVHLWSEDGTLLATGSQSVIVRLRD